MKKVWMLLALFSIESFAAEFTNIKLTPAFEAAIVQGTPVSAPTQSALGFTKQVSSIASAKSLSSSVASTASSAFNLMIRSQLLGADLSKDSSSSLGIPADGETSPLMDEIRAQLLASHQGIGTAQVANINSLNQQFNLGSQNFSGFTWQKPMGSVNIHVDRQVIPPALVDQWMVHDTFTIDIQATTFLEKLKEAGLSPMTDLEIGAFAGITFHRVYTYDHFAPSYMEGLGSDFSKLFLPFLKFNQAGMAAMQNNEVMKKEDLWTAKAGAIISSPPFYGFSASGGILAQADLGQAVSIESSVSSDASAKRYGISVLSKKSVTAGATASLQLDFFKIIQLTLLRFDLNYTYASGKEYFLGLNTNQYHKVISNSDENSEFKKILTGFGSVKLLEPYVTLLEDTTSENLETYGSVLLWGKTRKTGTEVVSTIKDGKVQLFHRNYAQSVKYVQNLLSRLFSAVFYKLLKLPVGVQNVAIYSKEVQMEYKVSHPQATDPNIIRLNSSEEFSFTLNQSYEAHGTMKKSEKTYKADIQWFIDDFTTLPKTFIKDFETNALRGPVLVNSALRVDKAGFDYFIKRSLSDLFIQLAKVCGSKKGADWSNDQKRPGMLKEKQSGSDKCVQGMGVDAVDFLSDYQANYSKPAIAKFSKFLKAYYKLTDNVADLITLFGAENTFLNGTIQATSSIGSNFVQNFSNGQYRGLGVIDNFVKEATRAPASISE
jgi:hypothetical protein